MKFKKERRRNPRITLNYLLSAPIIYSLFFPLVLMDLWGELYHRLCFPLYGIPYVKRSDYIRVDRHKLSYLHWLEKINCAYCGYANGLLPYLAAIAAETEKYWCGIMHEKYNGFKPKHHEKFLPYGDEQALKKFLDDE